MLREWMRGLAVPVAVVLALAVASPASADETSDTQQQINAITAQLDQLQAEAGTRGEAAVTATAKADAARTALDASSAKVEGLQRQIAASGSLVDEARSRSAALVRQLTRGQASFGPSVELATSDDPSQSLWRLSVLGEISARQSEQIDAARAQLGEYQSLVDQERAADAERQRVADQATQEATAAQQASADADAAVAAQQSQQAALFTRLADLKRTTAAAEEEARRRQQLAASYAQSNEPGNGTSSTPTPAPAPPSTPTPAPQPTQPKPSQPAPSQPSTPSVDNSPAAAQRYASGRLGSYGWGNDQFSCLVSLWTRESSWNYTAANTSSGAYGIPQALPGSKMGSSGADWRTNSQTQIDWGLGYIQTTYGSPCGAWGHSQSSGWY